MVLCDPFAACLERREAKPARQNQNAVGRSRSTPPDCGPPMRRTWMRASAFWRRRLKVGLPNAQRSASTRLREKLLRPAKSPTAGLGHSDQNKRKSRERAARAIRPT